MALAVITRQLPTDGRTSKGGIAFTALSLDSLLSYSRDQRDEKAFEVALFAEAFVECLTTRFGCSIMGCLAALDQQASACEGFRAQIQHTVSFPVVQVVAGKRIRQP